MQVEIEERSPVRYQRWFVEGNLSGDKKATMGSLAGVRGRKVCAEIELPGELVERRLHTTVDALVDYWRLSAVAGVMSGSIGVHGHYANGLAAMFIACGQDAACVAEAAVGITRFEPRPGGALYAAVTLPNLIVGTVGGGTRLPSQRACLDIMGLSGPDARAFAEVAAAMALAGELSITGALAAGSSRARTSVSLVVRSKESRDEPLDRVSAGTVSTSGARAARRGVQRLCRVLLIAGTRAVAVPQLTSLVVAFATSLLFFLQLRIADEMKDADEDARFRPYRPVPRGLVTLRASRDRHCRAVVQLALALWLDRGLVWLLLLPWAWLLLMSREFFVPRWLRAHPIFYMTSHMVVLPLIDLVRDRVRLASERDRGARRPRLVPDRQLPQWHRRRDRAQDAGADRRGARRRDVRSLWGARRAAHAWLLAVFMTAAAAWAASARIGTEHAALLMLGVLVITCGIVASIREGWPDRRR